MSYGTSSFGREAYGSDSDVLVSTDTTPRQFFEIEYVADSGVWTDLGADLRKRSTDRGRGSESDAFRAGTMQATLNNRTRAYDPEVNTLLRPGLRVRLREHYNSTTYEMFTGFLDRIEQSYEYPNEAVAIFSCSDGFQVLQAAGLPGSVFELEMRADSPTTWFRLGEGSPATARLDGDLTSAALAADSVTGLTAPIAGSEVVFGSAALVRRDNGTSASFTAVDDLVDISAFALVNRSAWTLEFVMQHDTVIGTSAFYAYAQVAATQIQPNFVTVFMPTPGTGNDGEIMVQVVDSTGTSSISYSTTRVDDNVPHHVAVTYTTAGTITVYIDGSAANNVVFSTGATALIAAKRTAYIGSTNLGVNQSFDGLLQEFAMYTRVLSDTRILEHAKAMRVTQGQWFGDTATQRVVRVLNQAGWSTTDRIFGSVNGSILQDTSLGGTALTYLQSVENTERGRLFIGKGGDLVFFGRRDAWSPPFNQVAYTFGDSAAAGEYPYSSFGLSTDLDTVKNVAKVSREGGAVITATDAASVAKYRPRVEDKTNMLHSTDAESLDRANFDVAQYKDPVNKLPSIVVQPRRSPTTLFPCILGMELGTRLLVKRRPQNVGSPISKEVIVEGISTSYDASAKDYEVTLFVSELDAIKVWVLDDPDSSILDSTTRLGF